MNYIELLFIKTISFSLSMITIVLILNNSYVFLAFKVKVTSKFVDVTTYL